MDSLFQKINQSAAPDLWHRFRIGNDQLLRMLAAARSMNLPLTERPANGSQTGTLIEIRDAAAVLCAVETPAQTPALFRLHPEPCAVCYTDEPAGVEEYRRWYGLEADTAAARADETDTAPLTLLASREERSAWLELERAILRTLQVLGHLEGEGEPLFAGIGEALHELLAADQLELELDQPGDYWPGKAADWVWAEGESTERTSRLSARLRRLLQRRERVMFVEDLANTADIHWPMGNSGYRQGFIFPLISGGRPLGTLRCYVRRPVTPLPGEIEGLELLRREFSRLLEHIGSHLQMQRMAMIDGLTSLFNHRFFRDQLRTEYQRALRYQKKMALIMIDIDDFKGYNDTYGHLAGDRMLAETAKTIRSAVRDIDFVARYGGEEFALILPEIDARSGMIVAEKIRHAVEEQRVAGEDGEETGAITISCGVTDNVNTTKPEDLIERADKALYWVKRHGRNLVQLAAEAYE